MQIIPAIDLRAGRCVRLRQGNYDEETVFGEDPAGMAAHWVELGAERLHLVDLDGAREGHPANMASVRAILDRVRVPCQLGGGVRSQAAVSELLGLGLDRVIIGTRAVSDAAWFEKICHDYPHKICLGLDARDGKLATEGWTQTSATDTLELAKRCDGLPLAAIIHTDINRDGMMRGVNLRSMEELVRSVRSPVIASGGITALADLTALAAIGVVGCIVGRALYEKSINLPDAIQAAADSGAKPTT